MFTTIFRKHFFFSLAIIAAGFLVMAGGMSQAFRSYFINEKIETLTKLGGKLAALYEEAYLYSGAYAGVAALDNINQEIYASHEYVEASILVIDNNYTVYLASSDLSGRVFGDTEKVLDLPELAPLLNGESVTLEGTLGDIFSLPVLSVAYPITINHESMGGIILSASLPELESTISEVFRIAVLCIALSSLISFVFVFFLSRTISKPLKEMNEAAKVIAGGNFERRITVQSKDEVGQLANSFNNMAESLDAQEKLRREFISNISHDLRSPITSMRGFLQAVLDGTVPEEKRDYYLRIVLDESGRLAKLANDIIDGGNLSSSAIELNKTKFDLNSLIRRTILNFEARVIEKSIQVQINFAEEKTFVEADEEKIQRVLYNLIDNAVKFTAENGNVTVETTIDRGKIYVSIIDTGKGIDIDEQKRVFDRFYKADSSRGEDRKGSGLGLSIVRDFVRAHGGEVTLKSAAGSGSSFTFALDTIH